MKKIGKYIAIITAVLMVFSACESKTEVLYNQSTGDEAQYLQFTSVSPVFAMTPADTLAYTAEVGVKILGTPASSDVTITITAVTTDLTEAQVSLASTSVTIAEGTTTGSTYITIDPNEFTLSPDTLRINFEMQASGFEMAPYGASAEYSFVYNVCPFDIVNFVGGFICNEIGYGEYDVNFFADGDVENRVHNTNFWDWAAAGATVYYDFSGDENQTITIPNQPFEFGDGVVGAVEGSGTYDACTGMFYTLTDVEYGGTIYPTEHYFYRGGKSLVISSLPKELIVKK